MSLRNKSILTLINTEVGIMESRYSERRDVIERLADFKVYIRDFVEKDTETNDDMKMVILIKLQQYCLHLNMGKLADAEKVLNELREEYPAPSPLLRRIVFYAAAILFTLALVLFPIPLIILVNPLFALAFAGIVLAVPAVTISLSSKKDDLEKCIQTDKENHDSAQSALTQAITIGTFFNIGSKVSSKQDESKPFDLSFEDRRSEGDRTLFPN